ncbi:haloacid dehalogenase-like hydrolase [Streptomyces sp. JV176]|uniref:HAD family hydrolase n=1 Tax=Streptomyces sp. JV176 TaxID=858630 RepID=UPI002E77E28F|nr:HAD hydrolase-like protein [Streptomyces sp. JV176]MEE1798102.1 haloacid dehalogenase-like hydrolase [Streptomyces sp. JV176]
MILVLWDIDRTLLYVGDTDRAVYEEAFLDVVGRPPQVLPKRGTGVTMPLAVRELLLSNGVPPAEAEEAHQQIIERLPEYLGRRREEIRAQGKLMSGAVDALTVVRKSPQLVPSIVTGNLQASALIKLSAFNLTEYVETAIGGYASDDEHRPALVRIAQQRAEHVHGHVFTRRNTVIVGDSLQDVRTGAEGGARVIAVASGTTPAQTLSDAGADHVIPDLNNTTQLLDLIQNT